MMDKQQLFESLIVRQVEPWMSKNKLQKSIMKSKHIRPAVKRNIKIDFWKLRCPRRLTNLIKLKSVVLLRSSSQVCLSPFQRLNCERKLKESHAQSSIIKNTSSCQGISLHSGAWKDEAAFYYTNILDACCAQHASIVLPQAIDSERH